MLLDFAEVLQFILPNLPAPLVSPQMTPTLLRVAAGMPPLLGSASLEIRLAEHEPQIDLLTGNPAREIHQLASCFEERGEIHAVWSRLAALCRDGLDDDAQVLVLEFDCKPGGEFPLPMPLVRFPRVPAARQSARRIIKYLVEEPQSMLANLDRCLTRLPHNAFLEYVGVMSNRANDALRVVVSLPVDALRPFLEAMQWEGDHAALHSIMTDLAPFAAWLNIQFDLGATMGARVGIAGYHQYTSQSYVNFLGAFDRLVERGLCAPEKRAAVYALHRKALTPLNDLAPYPAPLLIESLRQPAAYLTQFRIMAHSVKVIYAPNTPLETKVYVNFAHHWGASSTTGTAK